MKELPPTSSAIFGTRSVLSAQDKNWFPNAEKNCTGRMGHPLELMVLDSLRYLGRGFIFDDLEEATFISESSHRFFHEFIITGSTILFHRWVFMPETHEEIMDCMFVNSTRQGFLVAFVHLMQHIIHEKCHSRLKNHHLDAKSSMATKAFNIVVTHRSKILNTTVGLPGRWNDETVIILMA